MGRGREGEEVVVAGRLGADGGEGSVRGAGASGDGADKGGEERAIEAVKCWRALRTQARRRH